MRLGRPLFQQTANPQEWVEAVKAVGCRAAYCPLGFDAGDDEIRAYEKAARAADIVIAETGAWSSPLSAKPAERAAAMDQCKRGLLLADRIGARCCVNISGSRGEEWNGPHPANLTSETFQMIVDCVREIIDAVKPARAFYTLETMPWMYPDSVDSYLELIRAIDRKAFAVHFDPVNLVCSPQRYFRNADLMRDAFARLGSRIRSCHAKDIRLRGELTVHLDEVRPGLGGLDYRTYLRELARLDPDIPLMLEHLPDAGEYDLAADYVRAIAAEEKVAV